MLEEACTGTVFVIDNDVAVRRAIGPLLQSYGMQVRLLPSATHFPRNVQRSPCCIVLDDKMVDGCGLDFIKELKQSGLAIPTILISNVADVPAAVDAIKSGAVDFLVKPIRNETLLAVVKTAIGQHIKILEACELSEGLHARFRQLTLREQQVIKLVGEGRRNKQIAGEFGISVKTVKAHRQNALKKLQVRSVPDLVKMLDRMATK